MPPIVPRIVQIEQPQACEKCRFRNGAMPHALRDRPTVLYVGCRRGDCDNWLQSGSAVAPATEADAPQTPPAPE